MPAAEFADFIAVVRSVFGKYKAKLLEFKPGAERAVGLHQLMDREMKAADAVPVSCRKGCAGCCSYEVEITGDEAALLRDAVIAGVEIDLDRLGVQAAREPKDPVWQRFGDPDNRCVFLGADGACRVYESRPAICRKHLVTTPASACTTEGAALAPVQVLLAEILLSAELSLAATDYGSLSKMLTKSILAAESALAEDVSEIAQAV